MAGKFQNKVALVTGASSGIGRTTAVAFGREGAKVIVVARRSGESEETVQMIKKAGGEAIFVKTDVSKRAEVEAMVLKTVEQYGRLDYACNNAGGPGVIATTAECSEENWDEVTSVDLKGIFLCMKYELIQMLKQGGGAIVNIASGCGLVGQPNVASYVASKHGTVGLTKAAALETALSNIRVKRHMSRPGSHPRA